MNRTVLGALAALVLAAAGLFWWQGRAAIDPGGLPLPAPVRSTDPLALPSADLTGVRGPDLPQVTEATREQRRFDRLDHDHNGRISRVEMLVPRAAQFRKLDLDGNNLLTFEEWAGKTVNRFRAADRNGDGQLDRIEFATTKPKQPKKPACACTRPSRQRGKGALPKPEAESDEDGEPAG